MDKTTKNIERVFEGYELRHRTDNCGGEGRPDYLSEHDDYYCVKCQKSFLSDEFDIVDTPPRRSMDETISYSTASRTTGTVTDKFKVFGLGALWTAAQNAQNPAQKELLTEAHAIMSGVLFGTIKRGK